MANISQENINTLAQEALSISNGDFIYIYKSGAGGFARIEKSVFFAGISGNSGGISADVYDAIKTNVETLRSMLYTLVNTYLANLAFNNGKPDLSSIANAFTWPENDGGGSGGGDTPTGDPSLTVYVDGVAISNGSTINVGTKTSSSGSVSKTITVKGSHLGTALTASLSGTGFYFGSSGSQTSQTILANNANASSGWTLTVRYEGEDANATGTLTISSSEVSVTVNLSASHQEQGGGDEPTPSGYVDDGLVLHLDCQSRGNVENHWIDLVNEIDFALTNVTVGTDNGMTFGSGSYGIANGVENGVALGVPYTQGTIEVVVKNFSFANKATPFKSAEEGGIAFSAWNYGDPLVTGFVMTCSMNTATTNKVLKNDSIPSTISGYFGMNQLRAVVNGVTVGDSPNQDGYVLSTESAACSFSSQNEGGKMVIGRSQNNYNTSAWMSGTIYAIRVYNRQLSDAEMKQNYNVDKSKYGLE